MYYYYLVSAYMTAYIYECVYLYKVAMPSVGVYINFSLVANYITLDILVVLTQLL